ncbi:MAG TPA: deoxynucleoside kinase [Roseiflexaceae bacterium]|nr:deoxynucleoside kinase [Roseiflexaceae bacterium]
MTQPTLATSGTTKPGRARPILAVEGPIGAGKTTLARIIAAAWGADLAMEQFEENPFLPLFYTDPPRYAWQTQLHFLASRFDQLTDLPQTGGLLVCDYMFDKDRIFAELTLDGPALRRYRKLFAALRPAVPPVAGVVYLRAEVATLQARIAARARPYEQGMDAAYLAALCRAYEAFFAGYADAPVLRLDASALDYEHREADRAAVLRQVRAAFGLPAPGGPQAPG